MAFTLSEAVNTLKINYDQHAPSFWQKADRDAAAIKQALLKLASINNNQQAQQYLALILMQYGVNNPGLNKAFNNTIETFPELRTGPELLHLDEKFEPHHRQLIQKEREYNHQLTQVIAQANDRNQALCASHQKETRLFEQRMSEYEQELQIALAQLEAQSAILEKMMATNPAEQLTNIQEIQARLQKLSQKNATLRAEQKTEPDSPPLAPKQHPPVQAVVTPLTFARGSVNQIPRPPKPPKTNYTAPPPPPPPPPVTQAAISKTPPPALPSKQNSKAALLNSIQNFKANGGTLRKTVVAEETKSPRTPDNPMLAALQSTLAARRQVTRPDSPTHKRKMSK